MNPGRDSLGKRPSPTARSVDGSRRGSAIHGNTWVPALAITQYPAWFPRSAAEWIDHAFSRRTVTTQRDGPPRVVAAGRCGTIDPVDGGDHDRAVPRDGPDRPGWDGRGVCRRAHAARPAGCDQGAAAGAVAEAGYRDALLQRSARGDGDPPPRHHRDLRLRLDPRRRGVHRHGAPRGRDPRPAGVAPAAALARRAGDRA